MKFLNEGIARRAYKEKGCTGYFWQARFKSQALLSEQAALNAMVILIPSEPLWQLLGISSKHWLGLRTNFENRLKRLVRSIQSINDISTTDTEELTSGE